MRNSKQRESSSALPRTVICIDHSSATAEIARRRFPRLPLLRTIISGLVAVAIVFVPVVSAWAAVAKFAGEQVTLAHGDAGERGGAAAAASMEDCASMKKGASSTDDCPCCAADKACPPEFCLTKCFQLLAIDRLVGALPCFGTVQLRLSEPEPPPDWSKKPQPPPPRT